MPRRIVSGKFVSTPAKDYVRDSIDRPLIKSFKAKHSADPGLSYLGLPGEALLDILSWRDFLSRATAVQITKTEEDLDVADDLERNIYDNHLEGWVQLVKADIDELLAYPNQQLRWPYEVVNLDYYGGLVGPTLRMRALRQLFNCQEGISFMLFITLNLRDSDHGEMTDLAKKVEDMLGMEHEGVSECIEAHRALGHAGELKLYLPIFLANEAKRHSLRFIPPILYQGTRTMIHFAIECTPYTELEAGRLVSAADLIKLINMPLLLLRGRGTLQQVQLCCIE